MGSFSLLVRRVHLYLALICVPWFVMYAITAFAFNHGNWFQDPGDLYNVSGPSWTRGDSWPCSVEVPAQGDVPRDVAARLLDVAGIRAGAFGAFRSGPRQISAYVAEFWNTRRLVYDIDQQRLTLYTRKFVLPSTMTLMHGRAGYHHDSLPNDLWAVAVDVVTVAILLWVATGFYMWWQQRNLRRMGLVALAAGLVTFVGFMVSL